MKPLKLLVIEDSDDDAILLCEELRRSGYKPNFFRVQSAEELQRALAADDYEMIISDYTLPQFTALEALKIVQATGKDIPVIVVSGSVRESTIVDTMRAGARDYVMKENLTRLPLAVSRELEEAAERRRRREVEEQLRHAQRLESLGVLAGGVAHDFNNLLTGIVGNVSLAMEEAPAGTQIRPWLDQALQAAGQAANLTRQMLAYAGKGKFLIEPVNVSAAVRDVGALLHASVTKNIQLRFELKEGLPPVEADRGQIQQVIMNLVINAAEAIGGERAGTILVGTGTAQLTERELRNAVVRNGLEPGRYVCLEVRDTGPGMDEETLRRIFDPFFSTKFTGRGLGLSAVMGIVRSHKGTMQVKSAPGDGSVFTMYLPPVSAAASHDKQTPSEGSADKRLVLVIDDEETIRQTAKAILEKRGLQVFVAETATGGLEAFRLLADRISLVLLDLTMPVMSGRELLREVRTIRPDVPVLLSSGYDEVDARHRIDGNEVSGFLQKPYTAAELLRQVRNVLGVNGR